MPTVCLHKSSQNGINNDPNNNLNNNDPSTKTPNPIPPFLQTPAGLAIIELQGRINLPEPPTNDDDDSSITPTNTTETPVGRIVFPDYSPTNDANDTKWMKRVYFYIGLYQRMTGEVKELPTPFGVIQRRKREVDNTVEEEEDGGMEELEIVEVVRHRVIFSDRPEPVGGMGSKYG